MSHCRLCGEDRPLVRAHIVPECMYPFEGEPREPLIMVPSGPGTHPGPSRAGEYDRELVCGPCEAEFCPWDDYACGLLRKEPRGEDCVYVDGELRACTIRTYDYAKLKLFFMSLLWRASESSRPFFAHVSVGPKHTARLRQMIRNRDPGEPEEYAVFMVRLTYHGGAHKAVMSPESRRYERVWFWEFGFAGYMCNIKVDQRPTPSTLRKLILRPDEPLRIFVMGFKETQRYDDVLSAVRNLSWLD